MKLLFALIFTIGFLSCKTSSEKQPLSLPTSLAYYHFIKDHVDRIGKVEKIENDIKELSDSFARVETAIRIVDEYGNTDT